MTERRFPSGSGRIIIAFLAIASVVTVASVWWYYSRQMQSTENAVSEQVAGIAEAKASQIANWRRERQGDGNVLLASGIMQDAKRILSGAAGASDLSELAAVMRQMEKEFLYAGAFLVDRNGHIYVQVPEGDLPPAGLADFARAAALTGAVEMEDLHLDQQLRRPVMALTIPANGLGALILEIDPSRFLYPYLNEGVAPGSSEETVLVRPESDAHFVYLNELRQRPGAAFVWRKPLPNWFSSAYDGGREIRSVDYRGVPILAAFRRVPDSPWYLFTKIDTAEVDAPLRRLGWELAVITALIGITNLSVVGFVWRSRELRIYHEREAWFRAMANDTPAYLWLSSGEGQNSFINKPLAKFLGTDSDRLGSDWTEMLHPDERAHALAAFLDCLAARREWLIEFRIRRSDGQYRWVICRGVPRFSSAGEFLGYAGSLTDITDRRDAEYQLRAANAALADELAERKRHESEIESLTARLMHAQEDERKRLARELHDDLSQQLAVLSIDLGNLKRQIPEQESNTRAQSDLIQQKLVKTAENVRQLSHQLHPALLEYSGLVPALQSYCEDFSSMSGIYVTFTADQSIGPVEPDIALNLFRITQEALQNIAKHAHVKQAQVCLRDSAGLLCLAIEDRGTGIVGDSQGRGLGLVSMRERTRVMGGTFEITSEPNQGTAVVVKVPMPAAPCHTSASPSENLAHSV